MAAGIVEKSAPEQRKAATSGFTQRSFVQEQPRSDHGFLRAGKKSTAEAPGKCPAESGLAGFACGTALILLVV